MLLIALSEGSKSPRRGGSWIGTESDDPVVHQKWLAEGLNLGFLPERNGAVVVDIDDKDSARMAYRKWKNILGPLVETRKGIHAFFAGTARTRKLYMDGAQCGDIKGNGYTVFPPSVVGEWQYRFVQGHEWGPLPPFPANLFPEPRKEVQTIDPSVDRLRLISRAMAYATTMEPSVSFQHGHDKLFRFACKMVRQPPNGFGLSIEEAWSLALMFNARCLPPWDEASLRRKLTEAKRKDE